MFFFFFIKTEKGLFLKTKIDTKPNFSLRQCWWRPCWQFSNPHNHSGLSRRESIPSIGSLLLPITITKDPPYTSGCFGNGWNPSSLNFLLAALLLSAYGMTFCRNPCYVQISGFLTCLLMQRNQTGALSFIPMLTYVCVLLLSACFESLRAAASPPQVVNDALGFLNHRGFLDSRERPRRTGFPLSLQPWHIWCTNMTQTDTHCFQSISIGAGQVFI